MHDFNVLAPDLQQNKSMTLGSVKEGNFKDFAYYQAQFRSANVKQLLKDMKTTFKTQSLQQNKHNSSIGPLEWKLAVIQAAQLKAEIAAQKKALRAQKKALPSKAVTYKHTHLGEMTGTLQITKSVKILPTPDHIFKTEKALRPCQLDASISNIEIVNEMQQPDTIAPRHLPRKQASTVSFSKQQAGQDSFSIEIVPL